jgi:hypothetical protein
MSLLHAAEQALTDEQFDTAREQFDRVATRWQQIRQEAEAARQQQEAESAKTRAYELREQTRGAKGRQKKQAEKLITSGDQLFQHKRYPQAQTSYEEAAGLLSALQPQELLDNRTTPRPGSQVETRPDVPPAPVTIPSTQRPYTPMIAGMVALAVAVALGLYLSSGEPVKELTEPTLAEQAAQKERDRLAAEQAAQAQKEKEQLAAEQAKAEAERLKAEQAKAEQAKVEEERLKAEQAKAEAERQKAEQEKIEQAKIEREKAEQAKAEVARLKAEQVKAEAERLKAERAEAERLKTEQAKAQKAEAERLRAEQAKAEAERLKAEQVEAERLKTEQAKAEAERLKTERAEAERLKAEQAKAERQKIELAKVERERTERAKAGPPSDQEAKQWLETIYRQAWENKNVDTLVQLGEVSSQDAAKLRNILAGYKNYSVSLRDVTVRNEGNRTIVRFTRVDTIDGKTLPLPPKEVTLEKGDGGRIARRR